jgi:hypothetical protein
MVILILRLQVGLSFSEALAEELGLGLEQEQFISLYSPREIRTTSVLAFHSFVLESVRISKEFVG